MTVERLLDFIKKDFCIRDLYINHKLQNGLCIEKDVLNNDFYNWESKRLNREGLADIYINLDEENGLKGYK